MFAQIMKVRKIREKYGDNVDRFCLRVRASKPSVAAWESGTSEPHGAMKKLLEYAGDYDLTLEPEFSDNFNELGEVEQLKSVMAQYSDNTLRFAVRIGTSESIVLRWLAGQKIGNMTKRLIQEMHIYPERFEKL
jgi:DNA-binding transcriptional regulator YiaG